MRQPRFCFQPQYCDVIGNAATFIILYLVIARSIATQSPLLYTVIARPVYGSWQSLFYYVIARSVATWQSPGRVDSRRAVTPYTQ